MRVTRRTVFKEDGHVITGTTTLTVHLKDVIAARRAAITLIALLSGTNVRNFLRSCPVPDKGSLTTDGMTWVVGEPHFKISISKAASVFVSPLMRQIKIRGLEDMTCHGDWAVAIRAAHLEELFEVGNDARLKLHTNLMKRAQILKEKMS